MPKFYAIIREVRKYKMEIESTNERGAITETRDLMNDIDDPDDYCNEEIEGQHSIELISLNKETKEVVTVDLPTSITRNKILNESSDDDEEDPDDGEYYYH